MAKERLEKILAHEGYGSRKAVRKLLHSGTVAVNGEVVTNGSAKVDAALDSISVDGEKLTINKFVYLMMNKPRDYVCSKREGGRETVFALLDEKYRTPFFEKSLHIVGRLDADAEGFLIFTTDGALTHKVTSPKEQIAKEYFVRLARPLVKKERDECAEQCAKGFYVPPEGNEPGFDCMPARLAWTCDAVEEVAVGASGGAAVSQNEIFENIGSSDNAAVSQDEIMETDAKGADDDAPVSQDEIIGVSADAGATVSQGEIIGSSPIMIRHGGTEVAGASDAVVSQDEIAENIGSSDNAAVSQNEIIGSSPIMIRHGGTEIADTSDNVAVSQNEIIWSSPIMTRHGSAEVADASDAVVSRNEIMQANPTAMRQVGETSDECLLTIYEGKFHEVKRMFRALGNEAVYLKRIAIGGVYLDESLAPGEYRALADEELARLDPRIITN